MKSNKFWVLLIGLVFLLSCAGAAVIFLTADLGSTVGVYSDGELIEQIRLDTVTTPYTFTVETKDGGYNTVSVEQGRICVSDASCPDHVCVKTGWLSDGVVPIVCLPNKLVIQIEGADTVDGAAQ